MAPVIPRFDPTTAAPPEPAPRRRRAWRWLAVLAIAVPVVEAVRVVGGPNLHTVIPGQAYRASQPTPSFLSSFVRGNGIRTIVNLRGTCYPHEWYVEEATTIQDLGISMEDICLSAGRLPSPHELRELINVFERTPRPMLLHCRHGADRTGLACAVLLLLEQDVPVATAQGQLSMRYGHLALGRVNVLNRFFALYTEWLARHGKTHTKAEFRHWVLHEYRGGHCQYELEEVTRLDAEARVGRPLSYRVRLRNTSDYPWQIRAASTGGMHLGYFIWPADDDWAADDERFEVVRASLADQTIAPGETLTATLVVKPFAVAGKFRIRLDMLDENHCWFYQTGASPFYEELDVRE